MTCPCKDCEFRHQACWSDCKVYKDWRKHFDGIREDEQKTRGARSFLSECFLKQDRRNRRK